MKLKELFIKNKETFQFVYGLFIVILIPVLISYNSYNIREKYNENLRASLQRYALTLGKSVESLIRDDINNKETLQNKIQALSEKSNDFQDIDILIPNGEDFKIIASIKKENIEAVSTSMLYHLAWTKIKEGEAIATNTPGLLNKIEKEKNNVIDNSSEGYFWFFAMPIKDSSGNKIAILSMKISSEEIVNQAAEVAKASVNLMIVTIIVVIFFLLISMRFWNYAILYKKIKEVDQMKDEFISMASHELRTPLGIIKGYISLVLEGTFGKIENPKMKESLDRAMTSTNRLNDLVEDLLNVSRIEQGRLEIDMKKIKIEPVIEEITSQLEITAKEKNLALEYVKPEEELPLISADPDRLKQVLINLIGNSIKYTQKGNVKVTVELKDNKLEIKIADTGIGMSAEEQKHLFEKFYRIKNENTEKIIGTGLGLWITKQIVEAMKGNIYVESMKGVGTHISVVLNVA